MAGVVPFPSRPESLFPQHTTDASISRTHAAPDFESFFAGIAIARPACVGACLALMTPPYIGRPPHLQPASIPDTMASAESRHAGGTK
jgi:hypothetical protein